MAATYTPIASITLGANSSSVTFNSIPQTYTDLILVASVVGSSTASYSLLTLNSNTGANYSRSYMIGFGTTVTGGRDSNATSFAGLDIPATGSTPYNGTYNFLNYSNTTTFKTTLLRENAGTAHIALHASLFRSTSAITTITLTPNANSYGTGSTFNLYGILAGS
jgi:hypothetical protein